VPPSLPALPVSPAGLVAVPPDLAPLLNAVPRAGEVYAIAQPPAAVREPAPARGSGASRDVSAPVSPPPPPSALNAPDVPAARSRVSPVAPAVKPPELAPGAGRVRGANLVPRVPRTSEPRAKRSTRRSPAAAPNGRRRHASLGAFRSRASLSREAPPRRSRAGVTVLYGTPPASLESGPVLIRVHRGRSRTGPVRTTRVPLD
jgi:hypothetical protein